MSVRSRLEARSMQGRAPRGAGSVDRLPSVLRLADRRTPRWVPLRPVGDQTPSRAVVEVRKQRPTKVGPYAPLLKRVVRRPFVLKPTRGARLVLAEARDRRQRLVWGHQPKDRREAWISRSTSLQLLRSRRLERRIAPFARQRGRQGGTS